MQAVFSDVHGNLEALQAVLTEVSRQQVTSVYNLGDTMGCGPNPIEFIARARGMEFVLLEIFDHGVLFDTDGFGPSAEQSFFWARTLLESSVEEPAVRERRFAFLAGLSPSH